MGCLLFLVSEKERSLQGEVGIFPADCSMNHRSWRFSSGWLEVAGTLDRPDHDESSCLVGLAFSIKMAILAINPTLLEKALAISDQKTKKPAVTLALQESIAR